MHEAVAVDARAAPLGLFQSRDEASYVLGRLRPTIDREFADAGFHNVGEAVLGPT